MEIGYPTDMNEFKTSSDFSSTSFSNFGQSMGNSWFSQDNNQQPQELQPAAENCTDNSPTDLRRAPKKSKRKKSKNSSSPSSSARSSRPSRSRSSHAAPTEEAGAALVPENRIQVA
ncbi:uncharacterized protein LOC109713088 [Ananas comosus]|uniref:Uncharacterized protein LOC109713088 n=1 Tax=Ananas comosus TaxID=4615 RepID=A0A6P5F8X7_ANACO|nr:uncharacterized protein LOC109713088 [Ananas comosus]